MTSDPRVSAGDTRSPGQLGRAVLTRAGLAATAVSLVATALNAHPWAGDAPTFQPLPTCPVTVDPTSHVLVYHVGKPCELP